MAAKNKSQRPSLKTHGVGSSRGVSSSRGVGSSKEISITGSTVTAGGREVWYITSDGEQKEIVTSASSAAAMDEAVVVYASALKSLAKR